MSARDPERELEEFLRGLGIERPDPLRRAEARRTFLGGQPADASRMRAAARMEPVMTGARSAKERADEADGFDAWLAAREPAERPPAEVRRRARLAFLTAIASDPPPRRASRAVRGLVLALAAAAILAVTFLLPEPEHWSVRLDGPLRFEGADYALGEEARLGADLEGPGVVETSLARARFSLGGGLEVELLPGAALAFPGLPELDGVSTLALELTRGEAYLRTAPSYPGNPILVHTGAADVRLHGTTVGVLVDEHGTCVCVADGTVRVTSEHLPGSQDVGARSSLLVRFEGPRMHEAEPFPAQGSGPGAAHTDPLVAFANEP